MLFASFDQRATVLIHPRIHVVEEQTTCSGRLLPNDLVVLGREGRADNLAVTTPLSTVCREDVRSPLIEETAGSISSVD